MTKRYPYYLCQTKGCEVYGKSIPRDRLEGEVGKIIKALRPTNSLIALATAMFRYAWDARRDQAKQVQASAKRELAKLDQEVNSVLDRVLAASNAAVARRLGDRVEYLERQNALMAEQLGLQVEPKGAFEEQPELSLQFLSNPLKL